MTERRATVQQGVVFEEPDLQGNVDLRQKGRASRLRTISTGARIGGKPNKDLVTCYGRQIHAVLLPSRKITRLINED
jgi:hypothetical protein